MGDPAVVLTELPVSDKAQSEPAEARSTMYFMVQKRERRLSRAVVHIQTGLTGPVIAVGAVGGIVGAAYVGMLHLLTDALGPGTHQPLTQLAILTAVGLLVATITTIGGETGDVELMVDNIHVLGGAEDVKRLRPLIPASLLCVASGAGMGPEAPLVQTTGTIGTWLGTRHGRPRNDVRVLTITGMAAGFTVLFGAPLGSALFALEILHRRGLQYYEALIPAVVGSLCGYAVYVAVSALEMAPVWDFPEMGALHTWHLGLAVVLGVLGGLGSMVFAGSAALLRRGFGLLPRPGRYVVGGVALGLLGMWSPYALTFGEHQLSDLLDQHLTVSMLIVALLAKLAGTTVTLAAGWKGGFIIPLFFMGAVGGQLIHAGVPSVDEAMLMSCLMVALCAGVTKTPLGTTLVVTEMAGLTLLPMTLIAAVVSMAVTRSHSMIETQRSRSAEARPAG
jgi:H+/Cl- antiporter ClcA